jgi:hypothetical protein
MAIGDELIVCLEQFYRVCVCVCLSVCLCDLETYKKKNAKFFPSVRQETSKPFQRYSEEIPHKFPAQN